MAASRLTRQIREIEEAREKETKWGSPSERLRRDEGAEREGAGKKQSRMRRNDGDILPPEYDSGIFTEESLEQSEIEELKKEHEREQKRSRSMKALNIILIAACVYVIFLIYGVFVTDYQYGDDGLVAPQVLSVSDIREKKSYEVIEVMYESCRILYEETLILDYRVGEGVENTMTIAPEYEALLDEVENLSVKAEALSVDSRYSQVQSMLVSWIQDDIAVYLQNMSSALAEENTETLSNAMEDQARVYTNFSLITENMVALGENVPGVDLTDMKEWTPEDYVDEVINGAAE